MALKRLLSFVAEDTTQNIFLWDNEKLSVKFERTFNLNDKIIFVWSKIGSETAKMSINITISNICGAPQILDNFVLAVEKMR